MSSARRDLLLGLGLVLASLLGLLGYRMGAGLWGALGTDAALWGLTAMDLRVGAGPLVPPLYPALVGMLERLGLSLVGAGWGISLLAAALVPAAVLGAARLAGAGLPAALLAAVGAVLLPDLVGWSQQVQPDALTALLVVVLGGLLAGAARGDGRMAWAAAGLGGILPMLREHGLVLAGLTLLLLALVGPGRRWPRLLLLLVLAWLGPLLLGVMPGPHPLAMPWSDRAGGALEVLQAGGPDALPFVRELRPPQRAAYLSLVREGDRLGQLAWHARRSLQLAGDAWVVLGVVGVVVGWGAWRDRAEASGQGGASPSAPRRSVQDEHLPRTGGGKDNPPPERGSWPQAGGGWLADAGRGCGALPLLVLASPLLAAVPALLVWSERRHVSIVLPLAFAVLAAAAARLPRPARFVLLGLALLLGLSWPGRLQKLARDQQSERFRAWHFAAIGDFLAEEAPPGSLLGGLFQDVGLYHPLPRHDPDGTAADWLTFLVSDRPPPASRLGRWEAVFRIDDDPRGLAVYRLSPDRDPRPCQGARPDPSTPYLAVDRAHAEVPGCREPDVLQPDTPPH